MRLFPSPMGFLDRERGFLFPWSAVLFAAGIGCYFAWPGEPGRFVWASGAGLTGLACFAAIAVGPVWRPVVLLILVPVLGFLIAGWRAHDVAAVKLGYRYYGPIEGRVVAMDRSQSDAPRLTLDRVVLYDTRVERTPARVRVSIHGPRLVPLPRPGATVVLTGHLSPPSGPVEPGGYDFQRQAWFQRLGAVGYSRTPVPELEPPEGGAALVVFRRGCESRRRCAPRSQARRAPSPPPSPPGTVQRWTGRRWRTSGRQIWRISSRSRGSIWAF